MLASFLMKIKVAGWKETRVQVHSCEFCYIFKKDYVVVLVWTAASDILGYPCVEISSAISTLKKCTVISSILVFIHFKLILESCTTSGVYLQPYQTSMMKFLVLAVAFSQKRSIIDIWQGFKYHSYYFSTFSILILEWTYKHFCFSSGILQLICSCAVNQKYYMIFHWFPNHLFYTDDELPNYYHIFIQ